MKYKIKLTSIFAIISFATISAYAQEETSFGAFFASPVGKFKSHDIQDGGFAEPGWGIVLDSKYKFKGLPEGLTAYFHSTYQWNKMNSEALENSFTEYLGYKTVVSDSKYSPLVVTVGPSYEFKLSEKIKFGVNGTIGVLFNNTKAFTVKVYDQNNVELFNELINFDDNVAFAFTFGAELKYSLITDVLGISIYSDYTSANQKVDVTSTSINSDTFQKLQYFNTGLKLVFVKK